MLHRSSQENLIPNVERVLERHKKHVEREAKDLDRRRFLRMGSVLAAYVLANKYVGDRASESYRNNGTTLRMVGGRDIQSNLLMVSFGGEGTDNEYWGAETAFQDSGKRIPSADMMYDDANGLDFISQARVLKQAQKERGFKGLIINAGSEGGLISLYTALMADIPIVGFIANSCPANLGDAKTDAILTTDLVTSPIGPTGPLENYLTLGAKDVWCYFRDNPVGQAVTGLPEEVWTLPSQMKNGGSPILQESQLRFLKQANSAQLIPSLAKQGLISKDFTKPVFLEAANDGVINPASSYGHWRQGFQQYGIDMPLLHMGPGSGHADVFTEGSPLKSINYYDYFVERYDTAPPVMV